MNKIKQLILNQEFRHSVFIVIVIFAANMLMVTGLLNSNPVNYRSGLALNRTNSVLGGEHTIDPNDGFTKQALGRAAANKVLNGNMPLWNENEGIGMPLAAEMQSAALFPLTVLHKLENGTIIIHTILQIVAAIGTYFFLRRLKIRRFGSTVGGLAYGLSGSFVWLANAALNPVAFLPLLMLGVEIIYERSINKKTGGWLLLSVSMALALYSGFPETVYLYSFLPLGWAILRLLDLKRLEKTVFIKKIITAGIVGLLLSAPILVLFGMYLPGSYTGAHGAGLSLYHLSTYAIPALFIPYIYGPIFGAISSVKEMAIIDFWSNVGGYLNVSLGLLAVFGIFSNKIKRKYIILLSVIALIYLLRTYGFGPLTFLLNLFPGMSLAAIYRYSIPAILFSVIVLAILGIDQLIESYKSKKTYLYFCLATITLFGLYGYGYGLVEALDVRVVKLAFLSSVILSLGVLLALFLVKFTPRKITYFIIGLIVIAETSILYFIPQLSTDKNDGLDLSSVNYLKQNLGNSRFYTLGPIEPNYGSYYGISSINNNDLPVPKNWSEYITKKLNGNIDPILFTGSYMKDPKGFTPKQELLRNFENYKNLSVKYIITDKKNEFNVQELNKYNLRLVHQDRVAYVYEVEGSINYFSARPNVCSINVLSKTKIQTNCAKQASIIRRELYMRGWKTNYGAVSPYGDYGIFQAIQVPAGKTTIQYDYRPPLLYFSYAMFICGLTIIFAHHIRQYIKVKNKK